MIADLPSSYSPKSFEKKHWDRWIDSGAFHADPQDPRPPYVIFIPPPNVTAALHAGHALNQTLQDILARYFRMKGRNVCWIPGTDHAGISTQMMLERQLEKEGTSRKALGREAFVDRAHAWRAEYGGRIIEQLKLMGCSCDWEREAYTFSDALSRSVREIFVKLHEEGWIYRGKRLVNWDCRLQTALSDDEVEKKDIDGQLTTFRYPVEGQDRFVEIATTRPETMLGDTAVAVHPDDDRYKVLVGKQVKLPLVGRLIPIVADDYVDMEFGTGCVKITPAHDPNDFELGQRHDLPMINILNEDGSLNDEVPEAFRGLDRFDARKAVVKAMKEADRFVEQKNHRHAVPHSERSKTIVEPKLSEQWFVKMDELAKPAIDVVKEGKVKFYPDHFKKVYLHWMENIHDWCISRQLWWGHRIPIWYCDDCSGTSTGITDPKTCTHCGSQNLRQDEDVLDTWFSSWLWPVSTLGWPDETPELQRFYPSEVLSTASEIIFLWVARMIMSGLYLKGDIPFKDVYIHATVNDSQGRKMSKTLGNGIDPVDVIEAHGADALRYTIISKAPIGRPVRLGMDDFAHGTRFANKVWNATRFLLRSIEPEDLKPVEKVQPDLSGLWILRRLDETIDEVEANLQGYRFAEALQSMYHFFWDDFCDWYLELTKVKMAGDAEGRQEVASILVHTLDQCLRMLHPFMPFVTEELWLALPNTADSLVTASFPTKLGRTPSADDQANWTAFAGLIKGIRATRSDFNVDPKLELHATLVAEPGPRADWLATDLVKGWFHHLAKVTVDVTSEQNLLQGSAPVVGDGATAFLHLKDHLDLAVEEERLAKELASLDKAVTGAEKKLSNKNFVDRAPEDVVAEEKRKVQEWKERRDRLKVALSSLKG